MEEKIKRLKELLAEHDDNEEIQYTDKGVKYYDGNQVDNEIIRKLEDLADDLFITSNGRPNYDVINMAKKEGIDVFPGEKDSFGWLTGCVKLHGQNHTILIFG